MPLDDIVERFVPGHDTTNPAGLVQGGILAACLVMSAFFSGSETGLMSLNRYRLKHLRKPSQRPPCRVQWLRHRPNAGR